MRERERKRWALGVSLFLPNMKIYIHLAFLFSISNLALLRVPKARHGEKKRRLVSLLSQNRCSTFIALARLTLCPFCFASRPHALWPQDRHQFPSLSRSWRVVAAPANVHIAAAAVALAVFSLLVSNGKRNRSLTLLCMPSGRR